MVQGQTAEHEDAALLLWEALEGLGRAVRGELRPQLHDHGLVSGLQIAMCLVLLECGPQRLVDLARRLAMPTSTVSGLADRLVAGGLLRRERNPADRRSSILHAEPRVGAMVREMRRVAAGVVAGYLAALNPADVGAMVPGLRALVAVLAADAGSGSE